MRELDVVGTRSREGAYDDFSYPSMCSGTLGGALASYAAFRLSERSGGPWGRTMTCILKSSHRKPDDLLSVAIEALRVTTDEPRVRIRVYDRLGSRLRDTYAQYKDLLSLHITTRNECEFDEVLVEAAEGWDGYWFRLPDGRRVHIDCRDFRAAIDTIESDLARIYRPPTL